MKYESEEQLVDDIQKSAWHLWNNVVAVETEVACHDQARMDVLVQTDSCLIAIEAKLHNWNRVLAQAFLHRYCAHYTYVAVPRSLATMVRLEEAENHSIGVITIEDGVGAIVVEAPMGEPCQRISARLAPTIEEYATQVGSS